MLVVECRTCHASVPVALTELLEGRPSACPCGIKIATADCAGFREIVAALRSIEHFAQRYSNLSSIELRR